MPRYSYSTALTNPRAEIPSVPQCLWGSRVFMCKTTCSMCWQFCSHLYSSPAECKVAHTLCTCSHKLSHGNYQHCYTVTAVLISWHAISHPRGKHHVVSWASFPVGSITHNQSLLATLSGIQFWYWLSCVPFTGKCLNTISKNTGGNLKKWNVKTKILY